jgi:hypothetical protein
MERKRSLEVRAGQNQPPNMECAGPGNSVTHHQSTAVALPLGQAQQLLCPRKRRSVRRSRQMEAPLLGNYGEKMLSVTDLPAQIAGPGVGPAHVGRRLTLERDQSHPQESLQVELPAVAA